MEKKIKSLIKRLNEALEAYHNGEEVMSNKEYDELYEELFLLESKTGIVFSDSPTQKVGAEVVDFLPSFRHPYPPLSLDKTKDASLMASKFVKGIEDALKKGYDHSNSLCLMWKMDGSTIVGYYNGGALVRLVTRGNGEVGNVISHNAPYIKGLPLIIPYKGELVVRGEAVMGYKEFDRINQTLSEDYRYKNPRNLANASIQMLDSREMSKREIVFKAFDVMKCDASPNIFSNRLEMLDGFGFDVVEYEVTTPDRLEACIQQWTDRAADYDFPVDGLVVCMEDVMYADTLPGTAHNPHIMRGFAFKWQDEEAETVLRNIEWSASRTGLLNPVAVFDPVELCGTTVNKASLHNLSYIADRDLRVGDRITVYKANMIIPQIGSNLSDRKPAVRDINSYITIDKCPICRCAVSTSLSNDTFTVRCTNPFCGAKQIGNIVHAAKKDCLNIQGISEERIEFLMTRGYINNLFDLYIQARNYRDGYGILNESGDDLIEEPGWGEQSVKNLAEAVNTARRTDFVSFIHAMGIPNIGKGQAKELKKFLDSHYDELVKEFYPDNDGSYDLIGLVSSMVYSGFDFRAVEGYGDIVASSLEKWIDDNLTDNTLFFIEEGDPARWVIDLLGQLIFDDERPAKTSNDAITGKTFVITGSLFHYKNRAELVSVIERLGGKVAGSVSKNTDYLINNDTRSVSVKNRKAKELGVRIISEIEFMEVI